MYILILSKSADSSTTNVIDWLIYYKANYIRVNENSPIKIEKIKLSDKLAYTFNIDNNQISIDEITSFWYRRSNFKISYPEIDIKNTFVFKKELLKHINNEKTKINEYLHFKFLQKKSLGNFFNTDVNKIIILDIAQSIGILIPPTLITTEKKELLDFNQKHGEVICKAISEGVNFYKENIGGVGSYTNCLTNDVIDKLEEIFPLSLFQKKIEKKYELRIFFINNNFYAMAIFSQLDVQTSVDFRRYNHKKPNRRVPFNLPESIKDKLFTLVQQLNLNTGSIDMAVTPEGEYIFFEVNPIGQYSMTSAPCNYYLDKVIAEYLTNTKTTEHSL